MRIAALLHCAAYDAPDKTPVSASIVQNAVRVGEFFGQHAAAAFEMMGANGADDDAKYLMNRLKKLGGAEISERDLLRATKFKTAQAMEPALTDLEERGYIRRIETEKSKKGGRPSVKVILNPYFLKE